ncbi:unnamed protein product, partial [Laminaria digitata]
PAGAQLELRNRMDKLVKTCTFTAHNKPGCKTPTELTGYFEMVREKGVEILPVLTTALTSSDPSMRQLAAYTLKLEGPGMMAKAAKKPDTLDDATARDLLAALLHRNAVSLVPRDAIGTAIEAATIKNLNDEALGLIRTYNPEERKAEVWVRAAGIERLMVHSRLKNFDFIKDTAKDSSQIALQAAAFQAAWNMPGWSEEESEAICNWAKEYVGARDDAKWKAMPARLLTRCNDHAKWDKVLLSEARERIKEGVYLRPFADAINDMCKDRPAEIRDARQGTCADTRTLLEDVVNANNLPPEERAQALNAIGTIWQDDAAVAFVESKLESDVDLIKKYAKSTARKIEHRKKVK